MMVRKRIKSVVLTLIAILSYLSFLKVFLDAGGGGDLHSSTHHPSRPHSAASDYSSISSFLSLYLGIGNTERVANAEGQYTITASKEDMNERKIEMIMGGELLNKTTETKRKPDVAEMEKGRQNKIYYTKVGRKPASVHLMTTQEVAKGLPKRMKKSRGSREEEEEDVGKEDDDVGEEDDVGKEEEDEGKEEDDEGKEEEDVGKEEEDVEKKMTPRELLAPILPPTLEVEATLAASGVTVWVDGKQVYESVNRTMVWLDGKLRLHAGVHLLTLHQWTGRVLRTANFLTWQPETSRQLAAALRDAGHGRLLLLLASPEFTMYLSDEVVQHLSTLGSHFARVLARDEAWCVVAWQGEGLVHETLTTAHHYLASGDAPPTSLHFVIPRKREPQCDWYRLEDLKQRVSFCQTYDGYGDFCSCHQLPWSPRPPRHSLMEGEVIPVAIATACRLPLVLRQVDQLRAGPRGDTTPITIFVDGACPEAAALADLLQITVSFNTKNPAPRGTTHRVNQHIRYTLKKVFEFYPETNFSIILEDDLHLAPDFISYFHQTAPLLRKDPFLFFVNAFNYNSYTHTAHDPSRLYRAHGIPGYGWMTSRSAAQEMLAGWAPLNQTGVSWDWWLRARVMGSRDMLIPEVPRTRHMGGGGTHISGFDQVLFSSQPLNQAVKARLDVDSAEEGNYEARLLDDLSSAEVVTLVQHPCQVTPLPTHQLSLSQTNKTYLIYIYQPTENHHHFSYEVVALCLGINDRDIHENLRMMVTFPFFGNQVYVVACPNSPYCKPEVGRRIIYKGSEEDLIIAKQNPSLRPALRTKYAIRVTPPHQDPSLEFSLENRFVVDYTVGGMEPAVWVNEEDQEKESPT
ncbi:hypothetical protein Pmani_011367 [Petrolisthes manimaculis]|uniref:ILEI/PANDER domain-containing protein n=1 Tax=Petrolisthes manimaculis TaxID=1843537 RepID=A0AAE1Q077_9EUCA|nr:hypothetical protein Pmani_011367 [Petrolisthes manimaculis]